MPLNLLRNVLLQAAGTTPRRTALPVDEEDLLRTPDYNPQTQPAPTAHPQAPEQGSYGDRQLRPVVSGISEILGGSLEGRTQEIYDEYRQQIENKPQPSGWRTAAAIGTSFIRPLREGGVPGMLMNSPEQQQWAQRTSILGQQLDAANQQRLKEIETRGDAAKAFAQYGSDATKPTVNGNWAVVNGNVHTIMDPNRSLVTNGKEVYFNPEPTLIDAGKGLRERDGSMSWGTPTVVDGNVIGGGAAPTLSPAGKQLSDDKRYTADAASGAKKYEADARADSLVRSAGINASASKYGADQRRIGETAVATIRGPYSSGGSQVNPAKLSATARDVFQRLATSLSRGTDFADINSPEDLQSVVDQLSNIYDSQAYTLRSYGMNVPDQSFVDLFSGALTEPGAIAKIFGGGPGVDPQEAQRALNMAVAQGLQNLSVSAPIAMNSGSGVQEEVSDQDLQDTYDAHVENGTDPELVKRLLLEQYGRLPASLSGGAATATPTKPASPDSVTPAQPGVDQGTLDDLMGVNRTPARQPFEREKPQPVATPTQVDITKENFASRVLQLVQEGLPPNEARAIATQEMEETNQRKQGQAAAAQHQAGMTPSQMLRSNMFGGR